MKKVALAIALVICAAWAGRSIWSKEDPTDVPQVEAATSHPLVRRVSMAETRPATPEEIDAAATRIQQLADSANRGLFHVRNLTMLEVMNLRADANATQIQHAHEMGVSQPFTIEQEVARGRLVELPDSTEYWVLHNLKYSAPYVTPSTQFMLTEIAQRFQHSLDSLGVPRFRLVITSALRTEDTQAALRRINRNASRVESAHEFGTTVDVAYRRFAAPIDAATVRADTIQTLIDSVLVKTAFNRGTELQAILGRVIADMRSEGKLMVMMERQQPVYHMTVARPLVSPGGQLVAHSNPTRSTP